MTPRIVPIALALALASCGQPSGAGNEAENTAAASGPAASPNVAEVETNTIAENADTPVTPVDPLSVYVGKQPNEKVDGKTFLEQPLVKAAVENALTDKEMRRFVFKFDGPSSVIVKKNGRLLAWGCEVHNCGFHNMTVAIAPDGSKAEICYYENNDSVDGTATWYAAEGKKEERPGNCPSE